MTSFMDKPLQEVCESSRDPSACDEENEGDESSQQKIRERLTTD
jgi:hypothetical protein